MKKRLLSLFLCVMMLLTLVPVTALAQDVGGADDQAAAQEAVRENVEDAAPAEPVKPTEAEGPVVLTREEAALDEPAEEDIATQDETGDDQATIVSIACAEETDADGYVHVMEGSDVRMEQEKGEWMTWVNSSVIYNMQFKAEYIPAGSTETQTVTGNSWEIEEKTGMSFLCSDHHAYKQESGNYAPWQSGETYESTITLGGKSAPLKLKVDDNLVTSVVANSNETIELVKGENGNFRTATNSEGAEEQVWYYSLYENKDATFTVTLWDGTTFSGTREEINRQIRASDELSAYGIRFDYSAGDTSVWKPGQEYTVWYGMNGVGVKKTVTISDAPSFESITPKFTDSIELLEGVDGYYYTGEDTFYYDWTYAKSKPTFTVTLTEDGVCRYGVETYEGSYNQLRDRFPGVYTETTDGKTMDEWPVSETPYDVDVKLGTVSCQVKVKVVENVVKTIKAVVDGPIEVQYGTDVHFWIDENGKECWEYYYHVPSDKVNYSLTVNGEETVYTTDELYDLFEDLPGMYDVDHQMADGRWEIGSEHIVQMYFRGVVFDVPVKVVEPEHTVEELTYIGGSMTMASGVHDQNSKRFSLYDVYNDFKVIVTYDGGQRRLMSENEMYVFFGVWPDFISNQTDDPWRVGQENCNFYVQLCGQLLKIPVTVIENPVVDLTPVDTITLSDDSRDEMREGYYRYNVSCLEGKFKLTLTEAGADIYNNGETEFTGTLDEICKLLNCNLDERRIYSDQSASNVWSSSDGKSHTVTIKLGGEFEVPVTLVGISYYFESLELADENYVVKLKEGADAASCLNGEFLYDATNDDELKLKLTLTDAGMKYFGQTEKEFTRTISELFWMFQYGIKQIEDNVQWNADGVTGTATLGIGNGMFGDPDANGPTCTVNVKLEKSEVASVKCVNAPVTLYEGVDDGGEFLDGSYYNCYTMTQVLYSERAQFEVTLTDGETFTGGGKTIWNKLGFYPMADAAALYAQKTQPWSPDDGIEHTFTVYVGTASCTVPVTFGTATEIEINEDNFPDEAFRNYLLDTYMYDGATIKAEGVTSLDCSNQGIKDLTGIELFPNLETLECSNNQLTELTISLPNLRTLNCYGNQMTALDVSGCPKLDCLICSQNLLETLDVSQNLEMTDLRCFDNRLTALDVSKNAKLEYLMCEENRLTALDVSSNPALVYLVCYTNQLTTLDVSRNLKLDYFACGDNPLGTLDVSKNTELLELYCEKSGLSTLDISKNTKLMYLGCDRNSLTALDLSNNPDLVYLYCEENQLTALDLSKNLNLVELYCGENQLTELDVSKHMKLQYLNCAGNKLTVLYLPGTGVETSVFSRIAAFFSPATYADEAAGPALTDLDCSRNKLKNLDASKCEKLEVLLCTENQSDALVVNVAKLENLTLSTVDAAGTVEIRQDNTPVSGNSVSKEFDVNGAILTLSQGNTVKYKTVSYKGEYCFNAVADGVYTLTVVAEDYVTRSVEVTVTDGVITGMENFKIAMRGDMNLDGTVDVYDLQLLYECVSEITEVTDDYVMAVADVNGRDGVDITDVQLLYAILTGSGGVSSAKTG